METARIAELAAVLLILLCAVQGWHRGFVMKIYTLIRLVLLLVLTMILVPVILPFFPAHIAGKEGFSFVVSFLAAAVLLHIFAKLLKIVDKIPIVGTVNKLGGAILGVVLGILFIWLLLFLAGSFQEIPWCYRITSSIRESEVLMMLYQFNPFTYFMKYFDFPTL